MGKVLECGLDCCFRAYLVQDSEGHLLAVEALPPDMVEELDPATICTATREEWEAEISEELHEMNHPALDGYMGSVPVDCPIYQGEVTPPWEEDHAAT